VLDAIFIKRFHRGPMDSRPRARLVAGRGLEGNADQGGRRQVTLITRERWDELMARLGVSLDPSSRRANLVIKGVDLADSNGRVLQIGPCRVRLVGETRPCERMDEAAQGLRAAMRECWGGGGYGEVLNDGEIEVGDEVRWERS
jgi:MOSC domain-containing protein YiiM